MRFTIIVFPGTNCDHDCHYVLAQVFQQEVRYVWHQEEELGITDCVILPGGFSYGDYLRTGSIARFSPIMAAVMRFASEGGFVLGICNGFQILLEAGLLPGAMLRNKSLRFICRDVFLRTENNTTVFTNALKPRQIVTIPIAHMEGNYFASPEVLSDLQKNEQIIFRYCSAEGDIQTESNPNGSLDNIAGIINAEGNVFGLMPHPERCSEMLLGNNDGQYIFNSIIQSFKE
ncbi:phosphoribosylformylglycinamidine synthase subunit PurQ [candidate division CSSED10-310 bacterium]|uniref:Phosphoribosylformylglycinamidine synthase subunit PurQ n=1 Tax=candidate division CSSED10-310 bacterium TaxID=2855610 RepID=A0ABV6Z2J2_UNCC1